MTFIDPIRNAIRGELDGFRIDFTIIDQRFRRLRWLWDFNQIPALDLQKPPWVRNEANTVDLGKFWGIQQSTTLLTRISNSNISKSSVQQVILLLASLKYY